MKELYAIYIVPFTNIQGITCMLGFYVISAIGLYNIFKKAGIAGWKGIIPVWNVYLLYKISMKYGWLFLLLLVPIVGIFVEIIMAVMLAKSFGKGAGYVIGLILLGPIFLCILGFSDAHYIGPLGQSD